MFRWREGFSIIEFEVGNGKKVVPADTIRRLIAYTIDMTILILGVGLAGWWGMLCGQAAGFHGNWIVVLPILIFLFFVFLRPLHLKGQTPGGAILKIRVIKLLAPETSIGYVSGTGRFLLSMFQPGWLLALFRSDNRTLHDLAFDTVVVNVT